MRNTSKLAMWIIPLLSLIAFIAFAKYSLDHIDGSYKRSDIRAFNQLVAKSISASKKKHMTGEEKRIALADIFNH